MATSAQVADGIRDLSLEWDSGEELHQTLMHLHEIVQATQERLQQMSDKLQETPQKGYAEAVGEAASALSGVAERLQETVGGGVLRG